MKKLNFVRSACKPGLLGSGPALIAVPPLLPDPAPIREAAPFAAKVLRREMKKLRRSNVPNSDDLRSALTLIHCLNAAMARAARSDVRDGDV